MSESLTPKPPTPTPSVVVPGAKPNADLTSRRETTQNRVAEISSLLSALEDAASESGLAARRTAAPATEKAKRDDLMSEGTARNGQWTAQRLLRYKHPHSAAHCLRVALGCATWAEHVNLDDDTRDTLELAALMHDIGKIGAFGKPVAQPQSVDV